MGLALQQEQALLLAPLELLALLELELELELEQQELQDHLHCSRLQ